LSLIAITFCWTSPAARKLAHVGARAVGSIEAEPELVGRERELAALRELFEHSRAPCVVVLTGGAGIGKTALWEAGIELAREGGFRVLAARASSAEAELSFAALTDLLEGVELGSLEGLPAPQRRALEVALLRVEPRGQAPSSRAIGLGFLNVVRSLSSGGWVLIAVDDIQWLDSASRDVLAFAMRRLESESVVFLLARRPGRASDLERASSGRGESIDIGPLSLGAIRVLLFQRLGLSLPRHALRRLVDSTLGNPLFALEFGRSLVADGLPAGGEEFAVPDGVEELLEVRVAQLSPGVRRLLLAVALTGDMRASRLPRSIELDAVEEAVEAGVLVIDGDRVRASHPLLAAAARKRSSARQRRELHLELMEIAADEQLRARHLALATSVPDPAVAEIVAAAARGAAARGARRVAVELGENGLRLTPAGSGERVERLLELASYLEAAGEHQRVTDVLTAELEVIPRGSYRARAWLLLAEGAHIERVDQYRTHLERALEEAQDDAALRARVVAKMSSAVIAVESIRDAEARALEVLPAAREAGPEVERPVLFALAWARGLAGRPVDDLCERFAAVSDRAVYLAQSPERVAGQRLVWRGELEQARASFERLLAVAEERGELGSFAWARLHLCELELRIGNWAAAARVLDEWAQTSEGELLVTPALERCRALLAAGRGLPDEAERWAQEAITKAEAAGTQWDWLEGLRARGIAAVLAHDPARAADNLRMVWEHTLREGVDEPGAFPVAPELVEALTEIGEPQAAQTVASRLSRLADQQEHPWGLVTAARCTAIQELASGYDADAADLLAEAAEGYGGLGLRFERARCLLALGRSQRRFKQWRAARETLELAIAAFDALGSEGWRDRARSELERVGGRRRAGGELTPSERRVVELAAQGLSNKEIAATLYVTVNTVEVHLARAYAKLGVRSRGQLAQRLAAGP
jgi:DNA-binding CsgD family transcriptional regulator